MALDILLAQYPKQPVVRDRNFAGLVAWAASRAAAAVRDHGLDPPAEDELGNAIGLTKSPSRSAPPNGTRSWRCSAKGRSASSPR